MLVVTCAPAVRQALRTACRSQEDAVVQRPGRAALLALTAFGAFLANRLRAAREVDAQVEHTEPLGAGRDVSEIDLAAATDAGRDERGTLDETFVAGRLSDPSGGEGERAMNGIGRTMLGRARLRLDR